MPVGPCGAQELHGTLTEHAFVCVDDQAIFLQEREDSRQMRTVLSGLSGGNLELEGTLSEDPTC
jgi:hypothetical protein